MPILLHGTTRRRAERIFAVGPDPEFVEPGGSGKADGFSPALRMDHSFWVIQSITLVENTCNFQAKLGQAVLAVDVPDEIIAAAADPFSH